MNELHLFAGCGGGILGGIILGHTTVCAVEIEPYCRKVLLQRQRDGILPRFPIWDDIRTFDGVPWRGRVDIVCGGFPCQDISSAGKGAGITGERSGLWKEMARVIGEVGPRFALVENSPVLTSRGLGVILGDLAEMGYNARWGVLGSSDAGACHHRKRIWILAHSKCVRLQIERELYHGINPPSRNDRKTDWFKQLLQGRSVPYVCREGHEMANGMDRLRAIGNGQDPIVAALAWNTLTVPLFSVSPKIILDNRPTNAHVCAVNQHKPMSTNQFSIGQIVKGIRAGEFIILGFREIEGETYAQVKEHRDGKLGRGEMALPLTAIKA